MPSSEYVDLTTSDDERPAASPKRKRSASPSGREDSAGERASKAIKHESIPVDQAADKPVETPAAATVASGPTGIARPAAEMSAAAKGLYAMPERADRFLTKFSTEEGVEYKNPDKFSLKPAYFQRWQAHDYVNLGEHILYQFDPIPFARATGKPVEEVNLIVRRLMLNPLYHAEEACKRGDNAFLKEMLKKWPTASRLWADAKFKGELEGISTSGNNQLRIILDDGSIKELSTTDMSLCDKKYLNNTLSKDDWMLFYVADEAAYDDRFNLNETETEEAEPKKTAETESALQNVVKSAADEDENADDDAAGNTETANDETADNEQEATQDDKADNDEQEAAEHENDTVGDESNKKKTPSKA